MAPAHAVGAAERVSRHLASDGHSATRSRPCGHAVDPSTARPETIGGRTARKPGDRGGSRSGSWLRPDGPSGFPSGRQTSAARLRARLDTREFELGNLQLLVPTGRPSVFPRYFPCAEGRLTNYHFFLPQCQTAKRDQRQRAATPSGNRQIQLLRPRRRIRRAPNDRAARFIDDRSDSDSGRFSISTTRGQHHVPSSTLSASRVTRKHRAACRCSRPTFLRF